MSFTVYKFILFFLVRILAEVSFTISPVYQWENFDEIPIIKASIMVNIFIVENWSQIVHIEDHFMFYNSKTVKSVWILTLDRSLYDTLERLYSSYVLVPGATWTHKIVVRMVVTYRNSFLHLLKQTYNNQMPKTTDNYAEQAT